MKLERKDLIPIGIALSALGVQLGGVVERELAALVLLTAFIMLGAFFVTRSPEALTRATAAQLAEAKYLRGVADFRALLNEACLVNERIIVAADAVEFAQAKEAFNLWVMMSWAVVVEHLGETEGALYLDLAPRLPFDVSSNHPRRNHYRWDEKSKLINQLSRYRPRLATSLQRLRNPKPALSLDQIRGHTERPLRILGAVSAS